MPERRNPKAPPKVSGIGDAIDQLERRRRGKRKSAKPHKGDLDLDDIA